MTRENRTKGFFVSFDFSSDAMSEIGSFFTNTGNEKGSNDVAITWPVAPTP